MCSINTNRGVNWITGHNSRKIWNPILQRASGLVSVQAKTGIQKSVSHLRSLDSWWFFVYLCKKKKESLPVTCFGANPVSQEQSGTHRRVSRKPPFSRIFRLYWLFYLNKNNAQLGWRSEPCSQALLSRSNSTFSSRWCRLRISWTMLPNAAFQTRLKSNKNHPILSQHTPVNQIEV